MFKCQEFYLLVNSIYLRFRSGGFHQGPDRLFHIFLSFKIQGSSILCSKEMQNA